MKKLLLFFTSIFLLIPNFGFVDAAKKTLTLVNEEYVNGHIVREYVDQVGNSIYYNIDLPENLISEVENSIDQVLETKKQLTAVYISLGLDNRLAQLNNEKLFEGYEDATLLVADEYENTFATEKSASVSYGNEFKNEYKDLSKQELMKKFSNSKDKLLKDYSITKKVVSSKKETSKEKNKNKEKTFLIIAVSVIGLIILLIVFSAIGKHTKKTKAIKEEKQKEEEFKQQEEENLEGIELLDGIDEIDEFNSFDRDK